MMTFSDDLEKWFRAKQPNTLAELSHSFGDKLFAMSFLILMAVPALPLPTGGVTHVFEIITILLAVQFVAGAKRPWLPRKWWNHVIAPRTKGGKSPLLIRFVRTLEHASRPRLPALIKKGRGERGIGVLILILTLAALLAPPFTGLDTLPALGVVLLSLALIFGDGVFVFIGVLAGAVGIALDLTLGGALAHSLTSLFHR